MSDELTIREERYVAAYLLGRPGNVAAREAGYSSSYCRHAVTKLNKKPRILAAIEAGRKAMRLADNFDREAAAKKFDEAMAFAIKANSPGAFVKAAEAKSRLFGLMDKKEPGGGGQGLTLNIGSFQAAPVEQP